MGKINKVFKLISNKIKKPFVIFYAAFLILTVIFFVVSVITDKGIPRDERIIDYSKSWYYDKELTQSADITHPSKDSEEYALNKYIYYQAKLPKKIYAGESLCFKAKNCYLNVYILEEDGSKMLKYTLERGRDKYGKSQGTVWITIPISSTDAGKIIQIKFSPAYNDSSCYIDNVQFGSESYIFKDNVINRFAGAVTSVIMAIVGVLFIVLHFILAQTNMMQNTNLVYLGLFAITTALWSFSELKFMQLFITNAGACHNLSCMLLMIIPMPLFLYFSKSDKKWMKVTTYIVLGVNALTIIICNVLHWLRIADFHTTIKLSHLTIVIAAIGAILFSINKHKESHTESHNKKILTEASGLFIISTLGVMDIIRYLSGGADDSATFTRIGLLIYIMSLGIDSIRYTIQMAEIGISSKTYYKLAYKDSMTELFNRSAYNAKIEKIKDSKDYTIFVFDANNLKKINDTYGHHKGDELIMIAANIIKTNFQLTDSTCYRVGGDEFVCLVEAEIDAQKKIESFLTAVEEFNEENDLDFPIVIAVGAAKHLKGMNPDKSFTEADSNMYKCKQELKKNQFYEFAQNKIKKEIAPESNN